MLSAGCTAASRANPGPIDPFSQCASAAPSVAVVQSGANPAPRCLRIGSSLMVAAQTDQDAPWPPASSDQSVLRCAAVPSGRSSECVALRLGTSVVTTDAGGKPWRLTVVVLA
jgi:hypothetical protein